MRVAVSGASGLVGAPLCATLEDEGHDVLRLVRRPAATREVRWDPPTGSVEREKLEGLDGIVHLAGENVAGGRWTDARKERIRRSRVEGTRSIAEAVAACDRPPRVLINASAIGFYGDRGEEKLEETSPPGCGFLAETCVAWEAATAAAVERAGVRVVRLRIGVVLDGRGGALGRMLLPFRLGLGGRVGGGRQFMSWIERDDLLRAIRHALVDDALEGPVNAVAPRPVRNVEFARTLGRVLGRPTLAPFPAWAVDLLMGEMGRELLLASTRALPARLERAGFEFRHADLESALRSILDPDSRGGNG